MGHYSGRLDSVAISGRGVVYTMSYETPSTNTAKEGYMDLVSHLLLSSLELEALTKKLLQQAESTSGRDQTPFPDIRGTWWEVIAKTRNILAECGESLRRSELGEILAGLERARTYKATLNESSLYLNGEATELRRVSCVRHETDRKKRLHRISLLTVDILQSMVAHNGHLVDKTIAMCATLREARRERQRRIFQDSVDQAPA